MRLTLAAGMMMLSLAACGKKEEVKPAEAEGSGPQVATSIDDYALPVDKSDQVTAIDAATSDAGGMPRDGGAVVRTVKAEAQPEAEAPADNAAAPIAAPAPLVVPPPVAQPAPTIPAQ